ncbi:MAG: dGTPase, partial [Pseudomonadota bacterium]|nr:dGTPase [Pseudomonadota bacterium]
KGQLVVMELFEAFASDPARLLPENTQVRWRNEQDAGNGMRVLADYISGMTDEFATRLYASIFSPKQGGIQDGFHM